MGIKTENGNEHAPQNLKAWREGMGFNIIEAAAMLGTSVEDIVMWEEGGITTPKYISLACAALALGIIAK